ncbi:MAG: GDSL-type esterase/lipase family protein [Clostridia bacterium]|nr:GDSL-type esterase/lipase family protein [Clostridia bacterium]
MDNKSVKVMFTGDSVTDSGHLRPLGDGTTELGDGYVSRLCTRAWAENPGMKVRFQNSAIGGDTTEKLLTRFDTDIIVRNPDVLFIMIGINDCIRFVDENTVKTEYQIMPDRSGANVEAMIRKCLDAGIRPIILSPVYFDLPSKSGIRPHRDDLDVRYRRISEKYGVEYIDIQKAVDAYMRKAGSFMLSADRIHPKPVGAALIENTIYKTKVYQGLFK